MKIILFAFLGIYTTCLFSQTTTSDNEVSRDWTAFSQSIDIVSKDMKKFKITASVKLITTDTIAWTGLWARVDNSNKEIGFFDNMGDRPITSSTWAEYSIIGTIDPNSKSLSFGGLCYHNGDFYFDNFKLFFEDNNGVFQQLEISNPSFEKEISNDFIPSWMQGISTEIQKVKEFSLNSNNDAVDGNHSLLIKGEGIPEELPMSINPIEGYSPQIGTLVSMLNSLSDNVEFAVQNMSPYEIDYLFDEKANRIGALVMHLAAAEKYYQVLTFENRSFNKEEEKKWGAGLNLNQEGRDELQGHPISYYLNIYKEVRRKTLEELKKRDDEWLKKTTTGGYMNNHYSWFHVMEHQSSHLGQIYFLKKRIPPQAKDKISKKNNLKN